MFYLLISFGLIGGLAWYFFQTRRLLDNDPNQHRLAALLVAAAAGQGDGSHVSAFLDEHSRSVQDRTMRLNHAVRLAGTAADEPLQARVIALARSIHFS